MIENASGFFPVRVAVPVSILVIGGAEQVLKSLLTRLKCERFPVDLVFLNGPGPLGQKLVRLGFPHHEGLLGRRLDPIAPFRLARLFKALGPTFISHRKVEDDAKSAYAPALDNSNRLVRADNAEHKRCPTSGGTLAERRNAPCAS